jgi:hypothetical protein
MEPYLFLILLIVCAGASIGVTVAYRDGVVDGYGYAKDSRNPDYRKAGQLLESMSHRWPELNAGGRLAINPTTGESRLLLPSDDMPDGWRWL